LTPADRAVTAVLSGAAFRVELPPSVSQFENELGLPIHLHNIRTFRLFLRLTIASMIESFRRMIDKVSLSLRISEINSSLAVSLARILVSEQR
jgi:hypothetical protein